MKRNCDLDHDRASGIGILDTGCMTKAATLRKGLRAYVNVDRLGRLEKNAFPDDVDGHGTHLAGIVLDEFPDAQLYVGQVIDGGKTISRVLTGMYWLLSQPVSVVSLSIGFQEMTPVFFPMLELMREQDILPVVSIGNGGAGNAFTPGWYPNVLSVGSISSRGNVSSFSGSYHPDQQIDCYKPDLLSIGEKVWSYSLDGTREKRSGTSMANAKVAAIAGRLKAEFPEMGANQIEWAMKRSAQPPTCNMSHKYRHGIVDMDRARKELDQNDQSSKPDIRNAMNNRFDRSWLRDPLNRRRSNALLNRFVDPRLTAQINAGLHDSIMEAVVAFYPKVDPTSLLESTGVDVWLSFPEANTFIVRASPSLLLKWKEDRRIWMLNSVDIETVFA